MAIQVERLELTSSRWRHEVAIEAYLFSVPLTFGDRRWSCSGIARRQPSSATIHIDRVEIALGVRQMHGVHRKNRQTRVNDRLERIQTSRGAFPSMQWTVSIPRHLMSIRTRIRTKSKGKNSQRERPSMYQRFPHEEYHADLPLPASEAAASHPYRGLGEESRGLPKKLTAASGACFLMRDTSLAARNASITSSTLALESLGRA